MTKKLTRRGDKKTWVERLGWAGPLVAKKASRKSKHLLNKVVKR